MIEDNQSPCRRRAVFKDARTVVAKQPGTAEGTAFGEIVVDEEVQMPIPVVIEPDARKRLARRLQ